MDLFGRKSKKTAQALQSELKKSVIENRQLKKEVCRLKKRCAEKDAYFMAAISDGLRHGSPLAAKHMVDRREYLNGR